MKKKGNHQSSQPAAAQKESRPQRLDGAVRKHLRIGWLGLLLFLSLGIFLETLHGFKVGLYLDVANSTRRFMWTLAHAHGTLLALVNLAFAFTVHLLPGWPTKGRSLASSSLLGATILMPAGFFLGGVFVYGGDPGLGIFLLPVGAVMLLIAVYKTAAGIKHA